MMLIKSDFGQIFKYFISSSCLLVLGLTGCSKSDFSELTQYINEIKARPKETIKPLAEIKIAPPFTYDPEDLRDPFSPVERFEQAGELDNATPRIGIGPDNSRKKEELENYSLDTLTMVGTLTINSDSWALVKANDGAIYPVQKGNYMGRNHGKISQITGDSIELMEIVPDLGGAWRKQETSIALAGQE